MIEAFGESVIIYLQVIGFYLAYSDAYGVVDVLKYGARAPCTHFTFTYRTVEGKFVGLNKQTNAYTTTNNSSS